MKVMKGYASATGWGKGPILDEKRLSLIFILELDFRRQSVKEHSENFSSPKIVDISCFVSIGL